MNHPTPTEVGWTAGIIDGEGCIGIYSRGRERPDEFRLVVRVDNTDVRMLLALRDTWGGKVYPVVASTSRDRTKERPCWAWSMYDRKAAVFLEAIRGALVIKREQADIALEFVSLFGRGSTRRTPENKEKRVELAGRMKELKFNLPSQGVTVDGID